MSFVGSVWRSNVNWSSASSLWCYWFSHCRPQDRTIEEQQKVLVQALVSCLHMCLSSLVGDSGGERRMRFRDQCDHVLMCWFFGICTRSTKQCTHARTHIHTHNTTGSLMFLCRLSSTSVSLSCTCRANSFMQKLIYKSTWLSFGQSSRTPAADWQDRVQLDSWWHLCG